MKVCDHLLRGFNARCFIIMPFDEVFDPIYEDVIVPALSAYGLLPLRTDREVVAGNLVETIRDGLRHCYFAIADITGDRPNVMYELGMAHAHQKPVILLRRVRTAMTNAAAPFDLRTESVLSYSEDLVDLRRRLEACISVISGRKRPTRDGFEESS